EGLGRKEHKYIALEVFLHVFAVYHKFARTRFNPDARTRPLTPAESHNFIRKLVDHGSRSPALFHFEGRWVLGDMGVLRTGIDAKVGAQPTAQTVVGQHAFDGKRHGALRKT